MCDLPEKILLVVPCYNEGNRLQLSEFSKDIPNLFFLFVNDGSNDNTLDKLELIASETIFILNIESNVGKAEAVRQGMIHAQQLTIFPLLSWLGYWDADLSTPLRELQNFLNFQNNVMPQAEAVWGSRVLRLGSDIKRSHGRHILGRLFATVIRIVLKAKSYDSQCGAKIFKKHVVKNVFSQPFLSRWLFDVEILLRMKQQNIIEYPLKEWNDVQGSKLNFFSDTAGVIFDIVRIKNKRFH